MNQKESEIIC